MTTNPVSGGSPTPQQISTADANDDGMITREEFDEMFPDADFESYDLNGDGKITSDELESGGTENDMSGIPGGYLLSETDKLIFKMLCEADAILDYLMEKIRTSANAVGSNGNDPYDLNGDGKLDDSEIAHKNFDQYDLNGDGKIDDYEIEQSGGALDPELYSNNSGKGGGDNPPKTVEECETIRREQAVDANNEKGTSYKTPTAEELAAADQNGDGKLDDWEIADANLDPEIYTNENGKGAGDNTPMTMEEAEAARVANGGAPATEAEPAEGAGEAQGAEGTTPPEESIEGEGPSRSAFYNKYKLEIDGVEDFSSSSMGLWVSNMVNKITTFISTIVSLGKTSIDIAKNVDRKTNG
jgi:hypothetical protein